MSTLFSTPEIPGKSKEQLESEQFQADENKRLKGEETARKKALGRARTGRRSLIATSETGLSDTLG